MTTDITSKIKSASFYRGLIIVLPLLLITSYQFALIFKPGWWFSHENLSYLIRTFEYIRNWEAGIIIPRWCPDFYGGYGSPFFNYYAPLFFTTSAIFAKFVNDIVLSAKFTILVYWFLGILGLFILVYRETGRIDAALLATTAFATSPYRIGNIFTRGDLAESTALCLIPWIILMWFELCRVSPKKPGPYILGLSIAFGLVFLAHTITGFWTAQITAVVIIAGYIRNTNKLSNKRFVLWAGIALSLGIILASFYLVPAFFEKKFVRTETMTISSTPLDDWFLPWTSYIPISNFFLPWKKGWNGVDPRNIGPGPFIAILCFVNSFISNRSRLSPKTYIFLLLTLSTLLLTTAISQPLWQHMPLWGYTQFPYRMLGFVSVFGSIMLGCLWGHCGWQRHILTNIFVCLILIISAYPFIIRGGAPIKNIILTHESIEKGSEPYAKTKKGFISTTGIEEYLPDNVPTIPKTPRPAVYSINDPNDQLTVSVKSNNGLNLKLIAIIKKPTTIYINVFWFPGWKVKTLLGPEPATLSPDKKGRIAISLMKAGSYDLMIYFGNTPLRLLANLLSIIALIGILLTLCFSLLSKKNSQRSVW